MSAIATERLTKDYHAGFWRRRPARALDGLTFEVAPGEVFGFLGPNGAGKTTTLKLLMQLVYPTSGRAWVLGHAPGTLAVKQRIGYLPENPYFYDYLTGEELLRYFAGLFGYAPADCRARAGRWLDAVGIGGERRLQLRKLSKGMLQRVGLAQALLNDPEVVFLDEPMSGLDPLGRRDVRSLILRLRDEGRTVFFSSHILADAETLCSRVAILARGRLVAEGRVGDLVPFQNRAWEAVVEDVPTHVIEALAGRVQRVQRIAEGRFSLEFPNDPPPEIVLPRVLAAGGRLVSVNPVRDTLEDFFVRQVGAHAEPPAVGAR